MNAKKLIIKARRNIFGELAGNNISSKSGDGFDFYEMQPYSYGEDVRRIDWKRSAKMNEPYVKLFHQERQIDFIIVPILTGSLFFGLHRLKIELLAEVVALLGFGALKNGDRYAIVTAKGKEINCTKLNKHEITLQKEVQNLLDINLLGLSPNHEALKEFLQKRYQRRCMMIFVGDFWSIPKFASLAKKHEVLAINIRDSFEENPKPIGQIRHINPNNLQTQNIFLSKSLAKQTKQESEEFNSFFILDS